MKILDAEGKEHGNGNGRLKIGWETIVTLIISALLAYGVVNARVAVAENEIQTLKKTLDEVRSDVKVLLWRTTP